MLYRLVSIAAVAGLLTAGGCYAQVERKLNVCLSKLEKSQSGEGSRAKRLRELERSLADAKAQLKHLRSTNAYLTGRLQALGQRVVDIRQLSAKERAELAKRLKATKEQLEHLRREREKALQRTKKLRALLARFANLIKAGKIKVTLRDGRLVVVLSSKVLFAPAQTYIKPLGKKALKEIVEVLKTATDRRFQVAGHTDNAPIRTFRYRNNWQLSTARAVAVVRFMQSQGMPARRLSAAGYGQHSPLKPNTTVANKAENRRIEIVLMPNLDELPSLKEALK